MQFNNLFTILYFSFVLFSLFNYLLQSLGLAPGQTQRVAEQVDEKPFLYAHDKLKIQVPGSAWSKVSSLSKLCFMKILLI